MINDVMGARQNLMVRVSTATHRLKPTLGKKIILIKLLAVVLEERCHGYKTSLKSHYSIVFATTVQQWHLMYGNLISGRSHH